MRWFPAALFAALFVLPNMAGWVSSPDVDYWGMALVSTMLVIGFPGGRTRPATSLIPTLQSELHDLAPAAFHVAWIVAVAVLPFAAVVGVIRAGAFDIDVREQALKLAPVYVPIVVNLMRDAVIPFLILASQPRWDARNVFLWTLFIYFATFNLAKSFLIINTLAVLLALLSSPISLLVISLILMTPLLILLALLYGGSGIDVYAYLLDFIGRRILTLTAELGVDVRNLVEARGFYWDGGWSRAFEYELFSFIGHANLESGWANVYSLADAYGRVGILGVVLALVIISLYLLVFFCFVRPLNQKYAVYLWALFCTYIFMQGVFSFGLTVSFFIGPLLVLLFRTVLVK